jgi:hypothetical protein
MGSKWLTLAFVGSLGLITALSRTNTPLLFAADEHSEAGNTEEHRRALDLLRQATAELQADRFDAARRLAKQAADLNTTFSLFDVRPEHVLAEIERRERAGGIAIPPKAAVEHEVVQAPKPASRFVGADVGSTDPFALPKIEELPKEPAKASTGFPFAESTIPVPRASNEQAPRPSSAAIATPEQLKARAIEFLDRGLQALDEKRLDDADRYARAALSIHVEWSKLEYRPEYLITEVGIARARLRLDAATSQASPQSDAPATPRGATTRPQASAVSHPQAPRDATVAVQQVSHNAAATQSTSAAGAQPYSAAQANSSAPGTTSSRERAERLLQEALSDLKAGREDVARARIEGALGAIHPGAPRPLPLFPPGNTAVAAPTPPASPHGYPQPAMPRAGFPPYVPERTVDDHDVALKPLHDPFLGDERASAQKTTAGENSLREDVPRFVHMNPNFSLDRPLPAMNDEMSQRTASAASATTATQQTQGTASAESETTRVRWPESESSSAPSLRNPATSYPRPLAGASAGAGASGQTSAYYGQEARVTAPIAPPLQPDPRWTSASRTPYAPPTTDPWTPSTTDEHPGYFRHLWNALIGE